MSETPATLEIHGLRAEIDGKEILKGIDLTVRQGESHAIMGPNGSGKSTLANVIMGRPGYKATAGTIVFNGEDVTGLTADQRAKRGLFLAMQYPVEVPGVSVSNFLRTAKTALDGEPPKLRTWVKDVNAALEVVDHRVDDDLRLLRGVRRVEVDQRTPVGHHARQDREVLADDVQIGQQSFGHRALLSRF
jgi:Fe-S cluster assembly ATP-binding protein